MGEERNTHHHLIHQDANHIRQGLARVEQQDVGVQTDPDPGVPPWCYGPPVLDTRDRGLAHQLPFVAQMTFLLLFLHLPRQAHFPLQDALEQRVVQVREDFVRHVGVPSA